eukprot:PhF_6_TR15078/c0_g1_i1/m.23711/K13236/DECR1; 2,4-dienoyl-CoA reductase, mitochondrial
MAELQPPVNTPMLPPGTFNGRVAFITGGGTGLGKAVATMFHHLGCSVVITGRRQAPLEATVADITKTNPNSQGKMYYVVMDVRSADDIKKSVDKAIEYTGQIPGIIINNAAGNFISPFQRMTPNGFESISRTVLSGTALVTMDIGRRLIAAKQKGVFVSVGASYAGGGVAFLATSAAAKSGTYSLVRSLGAEWGRYGIRHVMISPGPIYTEGAFSRLDPTGQFEKNTKDAVPLGRMGTAQEYANLVAYVCSDFGSWMTGTNICFDGGSNAVGGEFHGLNKVKDKEWDMMESAIRKTTEKDKKSRVAAAPAARSKL